MSETVSLPGDKLEKLVAYLSYYPPGDGGHSPWHPHLRPTGPILKAEQPHPDPWRYRKLACSTAAYLVWLHDTARAAGAKQPDATAVRLITRIDDDGCGNDFRLVRLRFGLDHLVPHVPEPPEPPIVTAHPAETLAFGVEFHACGTALGDSPLAQAMARAGAHIAAAGLGGLNQLA